MAGDAYYSKMVGAPQGWQRLGFERARARGRGCTGASERPDVCMSGWARVRERVAERACAGKRACERASTSARARASGCARAGASVRVRAIMRVSERMQECARAARARERAGTRACMRGGACKSVSGWCARAIGCAVCRCMSVSGRSRVRAASAVCAFV